MPRCLSVGLLLVGVTALFWNSRAGVADDAARPLTQEELFDGKRLLDVRIEVTPEHWKALSGQALDFVTAFGKGPVVGAYTYFPAEITIDGQKVGKVELRKKGFFGSMDAVRPSLKVRFTDPAQVKLVGGFDKLTLNNNKQDRALASQFLSYRLFQAAGLPAPRCSLARVTVNGESLGVYTHVESVDQQFLRRNFGSDTGNLYEGVFPTDFLADRIDRFEGKTNKRDTDRADLRRVAELLEQPGDDLVAQLSQHIDLEQFIRFWAVESLIGFWDGYASNQNNYFIYNDPKDAKFRFIPWGTDMTMVPPFLPGGGSKSVYTKGLLSWHLNQNPAIRQQYHETLLHLLENVWKEASLLAEVDRIQELVKGQLHAAQAGSEQSAETMRMFIRNRRAEIMEEVKDGPVHVATTPAKPFYTREAGTVAGSFATEWTPAGAKETVESAEAKLELDLDGETVTLEHLVAVSRPSPFPNFGGPPGPPPPTVVLSGVRASDNKKITLTLTFTPEQFHGDDAKTITVQGMLMEGAGFGFGPGMRTLQGKVRLKSAAREPGARVEGTVSGKLFEFRGGFGG